MDVHALMCKRTHALTHTNTIACTHFLIFSVPLAALSVPLESSSGSVTSSLALDPFRAISTHLPALFLSQEPLCP